MGWNPPGPLPSTHTAVATSSESMLILLPMAESVCFPSGRSTLWTSGMGPPLQAPATRDFPRC